MISAHRRLGAFVSLILVGYANPASSEDALPSLNVKGLLDARLALTDNARSWEDGGFGKTRYGGDVAGDSQTLARVAEASLIVQSQLTWDLATVAHITANSQQKNTVDVVEAFILQARPHKCFWRQGESGCVLPARLA